MHRLARQCKIERRARRLVVISIRYRSIIQLASRRIRIYPP
jgi:hypothetical protein